MDEGLGYGGGVPVTLLVADPDRRRGGGLEWWPLRMPPVLALPAEKPVGLRVVLAVVAEGVLLKRQLDAAVESVRVVLPLEMRGLDAGPPPPSSSAAVCGRLRSARS